MQRTITIGRWMAELHRRAIHITRGPSRRCPKCHGEGGSEWGGDLNADGTLASDWEVELCDCWNPIGFRISLWRRSRRDEAVPF